MPELGIQRVDTDVRVGIGLDSSEEKPGACVVVVYPYTRMLACGFCVGILVRLLSERK